MTLAQTLDTQTKKVLTGFPVQGQELLRAYYTIKGEFIREKHGLDQLRLEKLHWNEMLVLDISRGVTLEKPEIQAYTERVWGPKSII